MTDIRRRYGCDTGACVQAETVGASTRIWETAQPDLVVVTSTESWLALLQPVRDEAAAEERARIVAWLRAEAERRPKRVVFGGDVVDGVDAVGLKLGADLIERGEFADVAAGDE